MIRKQKKALETEAQAFIANLVCANDAERVKPFIDKLLGLIPVTPAPPETRPERWSAAIEKLREGLSMLQDVREEYQDWRDNLPEGLQDSPTAYALDELLDKDIDGLESAIEDFAEATLPRGFGRD